MKLRGIIFTAIILILTVTACCAVLTLDSAAATYSGYCGGEGDGTNLAWSLDTGTGVLSITGSGRMKNYASNTAPWYSYRSSIKSVAIGNGVTSIGIYVFDGCSGLTSIIFEENSKLTSIGNDAFSNCTRLTSIIIPSGVTSIGYGAFWGCSRLASVTFGENSKLTNIGEGAFFGCSGLISITISDSVTSIDTSAFRGCSGLTSITIPESVTSIGDDVFCGCSKLTSITIPSGVTSIGDWAFFDCSGLTSITVTQGNTVYHSAGNCLIKTADKILLQGCNTSVIPTDGSVTSIGNSAFRGCSGLTSITIPSGITSIGEGAFSGCSGLASVTFSENSKLTNIGGYTFKNCTGLTSITIPSGVTNIGNYAFYDCSGLTSITIPSGVTNIGECAFSGCRGLTSITFGENSKLTSIGTYAFYGCSGLTSITIPESVTRIGSFAFEGCGGLTSITIPSGVTNIGTSAFSYCSGLTSITIPKSLTSISYYAFSGCTALTTVYYSGTAEDWAKITIGTNNDPLINANRIYLNLIASGTCGESLTWTLDSNGLLTIAGTGAMTDYTSETAPWYSHNSDIKSVSIGSGVTSIGNFAFINCSGITGITIPESVTDIGESAFAACSGLTSIIIPSGVASIDDWTFTSCTGLTSITIPSGVTSIGDYAFSFCSGLTGITIPSSVMSIGQSAFSNCNGLTSITISSGVTSIGSYAFRDCSGLTNITIPKSITSIGGSAFSNCTALTTVYYYNGTAEDWAKITIGTNNDPLINANRIYISVIASGTCGESLTWTLTSDGLLTIAGTGAMTDYTSGNAPWYGYRSIIKSVSVGNGVTNIGNYAFSSCTKLTSATIPDSVTSIGKSAFSQSNLHGITLPAGLKSIGDGAFFRCYMLADVTLPSGLTSIGSRAFFYCTGLTKITIPAGVTEITGNAFANCSGLESIDVETGNTVYKSDADCLIKTSENILVAGCKNSIIPDYIVSIGASAFYGCSGLTSITIPSGVTSIGSYAFNGCTGLTSITIPTGVRDIKIGVFADCSELESIAVETGNTVYKSDGNCLIKISNKLLVAGCKNSIIPDYIVSIGISAFDGCSGLTDITIPAGVKSFGVSAFRYCSGLTSVTLPSGITEIADELFHHCTGLKEIVIPEGVTRINYGAFGECTGLVSVTIPSSVTDIYYAFSNNTALTTVYYHGTAEDWAKITISEGNDPLINANIVYLNGTCGESLTWTLNADGLLTISGSGAMTDYVFRDAPWAEYSGRISAVVIPDGVTHIGQWAFAGCSALITADIPSSVVSVGNGAFYLCYSLATVNYPGSNAEWSAVTVGTDNEPLLNAKAGKPPVDITAQVKYKTVIEMYESKLPIVRTDAAFIPAKSYDASRVGVVPGSRDRYLTITDWNARGFTPYFYDNFNNGNGSFTYNMVWSHIDDPDDRGRLTYEFNVPEDGKYEFVIVGCGQIKENFVGIDASDRGFCMSIDGGQIKQVNISDTPGAFRLYTYTYSTADIAGTVINTADGVNSQCYQPVYYYNITAELTAGTHTLDVYHLLNSNGTLITGNLSRLNFAGFYVQRYLTDAELAAYAYQQASGTCGGEGDGSNLTWTLSYDGTLTISGSGRMANYSAASPAPWYNLRSNVKSVSLGDDVTGIGARAFADCTGLVSAELQYRLLTIGYEAFKGCTGLTDIIIPYGITAIGNGAFEGCTGLTEIILPQTITKIGLWAFSGCTGMTEISLSFGITDIGNGAFWGCTSLADVCYNGTADDWAKMTIGTNNGCLTDANRIYTATIASGACGENLIWTLDADGLLKIEGRGKMADYMSEQEQPWYNYHSSIKSVSIGDGVTSIGKNAFSGCSGLIGITIPSGVTSIGFAAFSGCSGLTGITIPDGVISIDSAAFYGCSGLTSITIPLGVTSIGDSAFYGCSGLTSITVAEGNTVYHSTGNCLIKTADKILLKGCNTSVIPVDGSVTNIDDAAFLNCRGLAGTFAIPLGVTSIGDEAFAGCSGLTGITIPSGVTSIGICAFSYCSGLTGTLMIPGSVTQIGNSAFYGCTGLIGSLIIPEGVTNIGAGAFEGCSGFNGSLTISKSVTSIGSWAFYGCSGFTSITVDSENTIYHSAGNCLIKTESKTLIIGCKTSIIPTDGSVTIISGSAFCYCSELTSLTIPSGVTSIGNHAFIYCTALTDVYYSGTADDWAKITIGINNECLVNANIHFNYNPAHTCIPGEWIIDTAATCTASGSKHCVCTVCGATLTSYIPATGHNYTSTVTKPASCTQPGIITHTCAVCSHSYVTAVYSEHKYNLTAYTAPTCTADGGKLFTCERCGGTYTEVIAGGHDYHAAVTKVATATEDGIITYTCSRCGDNYTETIPARPEANVLMIQDRFPWTESINATILERLKTAGYITGWDITTTRDFGSVDLSRYNVIYIANDQTTATYERLDAFNTAIAGFAQAGGTVVYGACDHGWADGSLGYPLPGGVTKGNYYSYRNYIANAGHAVVTGALTDGRALTDELLYSTYSSHTYFNADTLPAGATVILQDANGRATLVEYPLGDGYIIASGLTWEYTSVRNFVNGTSFAKSVYDDLLVYAVQLSDPCRHVYDAGSVVAPTCTEEGYTLHTCTLCGATLRDSKTPAAGHKPGEWTVVTEATAAAAGLRRRECTVCHAELDSEVIPMLDAARTTVETATDAIIIGQEAVFTVTVAGCDPTKALALTPQFDKAVFEYVSAEWLIGGAELQSIDANNYNAVTAWTAATDINTVIYRFTLRAKALTAHTSVGCNVLIQSAAGVIANSVVAKSVSIIKCPHAAGSCTDIDGEYHIFVCSVCGYNEARAHTYTDACDTSCNDCAHTRTAPHDYGTEWVKNDTEHWHVCRLCQERGSVHAHIYDNDMDRECNVCGHIRYIIGDVNNDGKINSDDAVYLLYYTFFPEKYPILQNCDFNNDGKVDSDDAVYLLFYTFFPLLYPLIH